MKKSYKENELRNQKLICCVTEEEFHAIKKDITKLGLTMSEYLRRILFDKRAHLLIDSAFLVYWMDKIAVESDSSSLALQSLLQRYGETMIERPGAEELIKLIAKWTSSRRDIARYMKKLIVLIGNN